MYSYFYRLIFVLSIFVLLPGCGKEQSGSQLTSPKLESESNKQVDRSKRDAEGSVLHDQKTNNVHFSNAPGESRTDVLRESTPAIFSPPPKSLTIKIQ